MSRSILLSVRPRFAHALLAGTKTAEVRRQFPDVPPGTTAVIYSSSPEKAALGTMRVRALVRSTKSAIWRDYSKAIGIRRAELRDYLDGARECSILELDEPQIWASPVHLEQLRKTLHLEPAQSFRYLSDLQLSHLHNLATPSPAETNWIMHTGNESTDGAA